MNQNANSLYSSPKINPESSFTKYRNNTNTNESIANQTTTNFNEDEDEYLWNAQPDEWFDDVRMNALFAPFRNRDLNPLFYDNKIKFWKEVIMSYCNEKEILQFDLNQLENFFIRKGIKPKCLELVLNEMLKEMSILTREDALKPKAGLLKNVFNKLIWSPIAWSTSYLIKATPLNSFVSPNKTASKILSSPSVYTSPSSTGLSSSYLDHSKSTASPISKNQEDKSGATLVLCDLVEKKSQSVLKKLQSEVVYRNVDAVILYESLFETFEDIAVNDLELILRYLEVNQKILITDIDGIRMVKFSLANNNNVEQINQIESSYHKLKATEKRLEIESSKLENQIESLNTTIKSYLKDNNKNTALKYLRKRKQIEKQLQTKDDTLTNIQAMIMGVQQADTNKTTFDVYSQSADALKLANKGLSVDKIDDTMSDIQDILYANSEIEEALAKSPMGKYDFDDKELNLELNELLAENVSKGGEKKKSKINEIDNSLNLEGLLDSLPQIPAQIDNPIEITPRKHIDFTS
jgi:charged multivesicular body protein 7